MARLTAALLAVALGAACAAALTACGGSDAKLLPGETAEEITENLDSVKQLADEGECVDAEDAALEVSTQIDSLEGIDPKLKSNLQEGADLLNEVVETCSEETTEETTEEEPEVTDEEEPKPEKTSKEEKDAEKELEKEQKEQEKEEKAAEKEADEAEPPEDGGENPGHGGEPPGQEKKDETPSGGIGPGSEVGGEG